MRIAGDECCAVLADSGVDDGICRGKLEFSCSLGCSDGGQGGGWIDFTIQPLVQFVLYQSGYPYSALLLYSDPSAVESRTQKNGCPGTPYKGVRQQHVFVRLLFAADVLMLEASPFFRALHLSGL